MTTNETFFQGQPINPRLFPCFVCQKRGFENIMIRLAGKDNQGNPVRIEQHQAVLHRHRGASQQGQGGGGQTTFTSNQFAIIENKLDTILVGIGAISKYLGADPLNDDGDSSRESPQDDGSIDSR